MSWLLSTAIVAFTGVILVLTLEMINAFTCFLHLVAIWIICDIIGKIAAKLFKIEIKDYITGVAAIIVTLVILCTGWYLAHHVSCTNYSINSDKNVQPLHALMFADAHMGTTFNADKFAVHVDRMQAENPDIVLIAGDFVDDGTTREEMIKSCQALSKFNTKYGVYFSYGNHDRGYMDETSRGWTNAEFEAVLKENGVKILEDEREYINENYCIIGRADRSKENRMPIDKLMDGISSDMYTIVIDHQPGDYNAEADAAADLVVSGHTHGGQLIPITYVGEWMGVNDKTYGTEKRQNTNFIVTSGISDWALKFKTGCKSEYVLIDINASSKN